MNTTEIIALSAVISPSAITLINNYYIFKTKRIENYDLAKRGALEEFSIAVSTYSTSGHKKDEFAYNNALSKLIIYFSLSKNDIDALNQTTDFNSLLIEANKLIFKLSRQIQPTKLLQLKRIFRKL